MPAERYSSSNSHYSPAVSFERFKNVDNINSSVHHVRALSLSKSLAFGYGVLAISSSLSYLFGWSHSLFDLKEGDLWSVLSSLSGWWRGRDITPVAKYDGYLLICLSPRVDLGSRSPIGLIDFYWAILIFEVGFNKEKVGILRVLSQLRYFSLPLFSFSLNGRKSSRTPQRVADCLVLLLLLSLTNLQGIDSTWFDDRSLSPSYDSNQWINVTCSNSHLLSKRCTMYDWNTALLIIIPQYFDRFSLLYDCSSWTDYILWLIFEW